MKIENISSSEIKALYTQIGQDEHVFELNDYPGIQIVRKYPTTLKDLIDKRMFIKFVLLQQGGQWRIEGGVDIVKNKKDKEDSGWTIEFPKGTFVQRPTNFYFGKTEEINFDFSQDKVVFKNKNYTLNEFIDLLEKNHLRDMFLWSRITNLVKFSFLHILFFLSDSRYKKFNYIFNKQERLSTLEEGVMPASEKADPLFHYFYIYKNLLGFTIFIFLVPLYLLSISLSETHFTASNPFLLFSALFLLYVLEKISDLLFYALSTADFVQRITKSTLELRGRLKKP
jgi:hypothetical protein